MHSTGSKTVTCCANVCCKFYKNSHVCTKGLCVLSEGNGNGFQIRGIEKRHILQIEKSSRNYSEPSSPKDENSRIQLLPTLAIDQVFRSEICIILHFTSGNYSVQKICQRQRTQKFYFQDFCFGSLNHLSIPKGSD